MTETQGIKDWHGPVVQNTDNAFDLSDSLASINPNEFPHDDLLLHSSSSSDFSTLLEDLSPLTSLSSSRCCSPTPSLTAKSQAIQPSPCASNRTEGILQGATTSLKRKNEKNKRQSKANKRRKKDAARESEFAIPAANPRSRDKYLHSSQPIYTTNHTESGPTTQNGYIAKKSTNESHVCYTLEDLVGENSRFKFQIEHWDGKTVKPLLDAKGTMYGLLGGSPDDPNWQAMAKEGAAKMEDARRRSTFGKNHHQRPRGPFPILRCGVSHGGGQVRPCNISHEDNKRNRKVVSMLNRAPCFRRIANFASSVFASWAPKLYQYYVDTAKALHGKYPDLERPFPHSAFSATTYNLGPQTVCVPHTDLANLAYGWCAVVALGDYDPTKGGHLVLWDCKLVVEFPPGSLILIPSAIIAHSNTPIQPHETRYSFTQYTAGALFRWVDQGFQNQENYRKGKTKEELVKIDLHLRSRWKEGLSLLPRLERLPTS